MPSGPKPKRIDTVLGSIPRALTSVATRPCGVLRRHAEVEVERDARVEIDIGERGTDGSTRRRQRVAIVSGRAFEDERKSARAIVQVFQDLLVGRFWVGKIDALHHRPSGAGSAPGNDGRLGHASIERIDFDAVIAARFERLERRALERLRDKRFPRGRVGGRKIARKRELGHVASGPY